MRILLVAALLLAAACHHDPNAPRLGDATHPTCGANAHRSGNGCECDSNYAGDGFSCTYHPPCDANATWAGGSCTCNVGYHGDGMTCAMDMH